MYHLNRTKWIIVSFLFTGFLFGCSSKPNVDSGRSYLLAHCGFNNCAELISFEETNATEGEYRGVPIYTMDYKAYLRCSKDSFVGWNIHNGIFAREAVGYSIDGTRYNAGEEVMFRGKVTFEKTKKGWRPIRLN